MISNKLLERAEELLGTKCRPFAETDPFNSSNMVEGCIGIHSDHRYGALFITSINGIPEEQLIFATPKLHYPFDRVGRYTFPSAQTIETYTKLDGTNIFMFRYTSRGRTFTSYKTRLRPFLASLGRFGDFLNMWKKMLLEYPDIPKLFLTNPQMDGFSFELYGSSNRHLMRYSVDLDTVLLFAIKGEGEVVPPSWLSLKDMAVSVATLESKVTGNYVWEYEQSQETMNSALKDTDMGLEGQEGTVWYLLTNDGAWMQFKCKPEQIENIHWASGGIPKLMLKATAYNVLESEPEITKESLVNLLLEEFSQEQIDASVARIEAILEEVKTELEFQGRVSVVLEKLIVPGSLVDYELTLPDVMRFLSKHFERGEMSIVYHHATTLLEKEFGPQFLTRDRMCGGE